MAKYKTTSMDYSTLYDILIRMEEAAVRRDRERVIELNIGSFVPEYNRLMPRSYERGSPADLYDVARNKLLNSLSDLVAPTDEARREQLTMAREMIGRLTK